MPESVKIGCLKCRSNRHQEFDDDPTHDGVQAVVSVKQNHDGKVGVTYYCDKHLPFIYSEDLKMNISLYSRVFIAVENSELPSDIKDIADRTVLSKKQVRRVLEWMDGHGEIELEGDVVVAKNYEGKWLDGEGTDVIALNDEKRE